MADFSPQGKLISIILPTYNESEVIVPMVRALLDNLPAPCEVVVVDDNSPDGTADLVAAIGDPRVRLIRRVNDRGLASAIMRGIIEARGDILGWLDADAWMMPPVLAQMVTRLDAYDLVIASRYVPGGGDDRGGLRRFASRMLNGWSRLLLDPSVHDYSSNFVVLRRTVFDSVIPIPTGYGEFFIELIHRSLLKGLRIVEVPYVLSERTDGCSKSIPNLAEFARLGLRYMWRVAMTRLKGVDYD